MHRRVRWENVFRVAGASLLVAVVVAWPRLAPPEPELPIDEAAPLVAGDEPRVEPERDDEMPGTERARADERRDRGRRRRYRARRDRARRDDDRGGDRPERRTAAPPPAPVSPPQPTPTVSPAPPPPTPPEVEFGFENG
jgi:hypothetical protein